MEAHWLVFILTCDFAASARCNSNFNTFSLPGVESNFVPTVTKIGFEMAEKKVYKTDKHLRIM